jgi:hypothetical protein
MTADSPLRPADPAEVADTLAHALLYDGNRRVHHADDAMARIKCRWSTRNTDLKKLRSDERPSYGNGKISSQEGKPTVPKWTRFSSNSSDTGGEFGVRSIFPRDPSGSWLDRGLSGPHSPFSLPVASAAGNSPPVSRSFQGSGGRTPIGTTRHGATKPEGKATGGPPDQADCPPLPRAGNLAAGPRSVELCENPIEACLFGRKPA